MTEWFYRDPQSRKVGPLSTDQFEELVAVGDVKPETKVWRSGLADWTTYAALMAHEAHCAAAAASGPAMGAAPESSSYSTLIALGASATNQPHGATVTTRVASDHGTMAPQFEKCPGCREEVPTHLFREVGKRRLCGFCVRKGEQKSERDRLANAKGVDANWIGKFLVRCALSAAFFVVGRVILFEIRHAGDSVSTLPGIEERAEPVPMLTSTPVGVPERVEATVPKGEVALPPDIELVPTPGR